MTGHTFAFCGTNLTALPSGALWWPERHLLAVSDLHLGRSERIARLGGTLLPPYEVTDTLVRLDAAIAATRPQTVICLGDSFDDPRSADLGEDVRLWLTRMMAGRRWVWIAGNHDPVPVLLGGECRAEATLGALTFRHIASPPSQAEISGHYHPKARIGGQSRACFLVDDARVILPAFGTYTGGLRTHDAALTALMRPDALAILTGAVARPVPMPRQISPRASAWG
jgi:uncharacterized protein